MASSRSPKKPAVAVSRKRRIVTLAIACGVVLIVIGAGVVTAFSPGSPTAPSAASNSSEGSPTSSSAQAGAKPSTPRATPTPITSNDPVFGEPIAQVVPADKTASFGNAVTARVVAVTPMTATGSRAGERSGPAVQVKVELINGTKSAISLNAVTVNAYYGANRTPASPVSSDPAVSAFHGDLAAGKNAQASYVFTVPKDQRAGVVVTVSQSAGSPLVVFQ